MYNRQKDIIETLEYILISEKIKYNIFINGKINVVLEKENINNAKLINEIVSISEIIKIIINI